jgi:hypothetical protein
MFQKDGQSKMELKLRTINKILQEKKVNQKNPATVVA